MNPPEEWRAVEGWPYEVSTRGRVRRSTSATNTKAGLVRRPEVSRGGYLRLTLHHRGSTRKVLVHHLVADAFLGPPPGPVGRGSEEFQVNHKDGDKGNNTPGNLEWVTHAENHAHASRNGLKAHGSDHHNAVLSEPDVLEIRALLARGRRHKDIARRFGVARTTVTAISLGTVWAHVKEAS